MWCESEPHGIVTPSQVGLLHELLDDRLMFSTDGVISGWEQQKVLSFPSQTALSEKSSTKLQNF